MAHPLITDAIRATAAAALDSLQLPPEQGGLGKHCLLLFNPKQTRCPNCGWDSQNKRSSGRYKPGGPQPFPAGGLCPVCGGKGTIDTEVSQGVVLLCNWQAKSFLPIPGVDPSNVNVQVPGGRVQTKGFATLVPRVLQSRRLVLDANVSGLAGRYLYTLEGEPIIPGNIVQGRYFVAQWKRAGA